MNLNGDENLSAGRVSGTGECRPFFRPSRFSFSSASLPNPTTGERRRVRAASKRVREWLGRREAEDRARRRRHKQCLPQLACVEPSRFSPLHCVSRLPHSLLLCVSSFPPCTRHVKFARHHSRRHRACDSGRQRRTRSQRRLLPARLQATVCQNTRENKRS